VVARRTAHHHRMATAQLTPLTPPEAAETNTPDPAAAGSSAPLVVDIVVPVYNEAAIIDRSVTTLHTYLSTHFPFTWRITIADNASTDDTLARADALAAGLTGVRVVHLDQKGRGRALRAAWTGNEAEVVAYMDVDLSTQLDALLPLVASLLSGHSDVATGSRLAAGSAVARGPKREFISRSYNALLHTVFGNRFRDAQCGFKAVRTSVAEHLVPQVQDNEWFFDTELLLLAERNGLRVHEVPVTWVDDPDSRVNVVRTARDDLRGVVRMARAFWSGRGLVDLGDETRPPLADDFGRQLVGFAKVGAISTIVSLVLFLILRGDVGAVAANLIAVGATAIGNTWANRRYTFGYRDSSGRSQHYVGGVAIALGGLALTSLVLTAVNGSVAQVLVLLTSWALVTVARFALLRHWVFRGAEPGRDA
jgi:putative flippase GtrA